MPCTDGGVPYPDFTERDLREVTAMLCQVIDVARKAGWLNELIDGFDGRKAGVSRTKLKQWIEAHETADVKRAARNNWGA